MSDWMRIEVWAPVATALFGLLVIAGAVRDAFARRAREQQVEKVRGTVLEMVEVHRPSDLHPFAAAIVEYVHRGEKKTFQSDTVVRLAHGRHAVSAGDVVTVSVPLDGESPWLDQPGKNAMGFAAQLLLGLAIFGVAFVIRFILVSRPPA